MKRICFVFVMSFSAIAGYSQLAQPAAAAQPASQGKAEISFDKPTFSFGTIPQNVPATHVFTFTNTGKEPLILNNVAPSCGCTTPEWPKGAIAPGKKGSIKATFNAAALGAFSKNITVTSNARNGSTVLTFVGEVKGAAAPAAKVATATPKKN